MQKIIKVLVPFIFIFIFFFLNHYFASLNINSVNSILLRVVEITINLLEVFALIATALFISRFLRVFIFQYLLKDKMKIYLPKFLIQINDVFLFITFIIIILNKVYDIPITGLLTTASALGVGIAFGMRDILADIFGGIALSIEKPFKINDDIKLASGIRGTVLDITWRSTLINASDETLVSIPNSKINSMEIVNYNRPQPYYQVRSEFHISYYVPIQTVRRVVQAALEAEKLDICKFPVSVHIQDIDNIGIKYKIRYYAISIINERDIRTKILEKIIYNLENIGVQPAYDKLDIYHSELREKKVFSNKKDFFNKIEFFKNISSDSLDELCENIKEKLYKVGSCVVEQGDKGDSLFIIVEGLLSVKVKNQVTNMQIEVTTLEMEDYFGEFSLLTGKERSATVLAKTDSILYEIKACDMKILLERNPALANELSEILTNRQVSLNDKKDTASKMSVENKKVLKRNILSKMAEMFGLS